MTEEEIVKGCQAGKERCQKMLYDRFSSLVMGISMRYAKNRDDAQDICQDVFVRVFVSIKHFKFLGSFEGWVRKIAVNSAVSWYRQEVKERTVDIDMEEEIPDVMVDEEIPFRRVICWRWYRNCQAVIGWCSICLLLKGTNMKRLRRCWDAQWELRVHNILKQKRA